MTHPLLLLGPGGDYRYPWPEEDETMTTEPKLDLFNTWHLLPVSGNYVAVIKQNEQEIRLTQDNLAVRIANLRGQGLDASLEMTAFISLKQVNDAIGVAPALAASHDRLLAVAERAQGVCVCHATMRHDIPCLSCMACSAVAQAEEVTP